MYTRRDILVISWRCETLSLSVMTLFYVCCSELQCGAVCCSVLQCVQCAAVCCSVLQRVAACCSVLQCVVKLFRLFHDPQSWEMSDMTHAYMWHGPFISVTWLNHTCDVADSLVWCTCSKAATHMFGYNVTTTTSDIICCSDISHY